MSRSPFGLVILLQPFMQREVFTAHSHEFVHCLSPFIRELNARDELRSMRMNIAKHDDSSVPAKLMSAFLALVRKIFARACNEVSGSLSRFVVREQTS